MNTKTCTNHCFKLLALPANLSLWMDRNAASFSPLFLRILLTYEFAESGLEKWHGENWFADLMFPFPVNILPVEVCWWMATALELIAPIALIVGFATRFFSLALICLTVVAIAAVHWPSEWHNFAELWQGYSITDHGYGNYKLPLMYILMLISLLLSGSGRLSVDALLQTRDKVHENQ